MKVIYTKEIEDIPKNFTGWTNSVPTDTNCDYTLIYVENGILKDDTSGRYITSIKKLLYKETKLGKLIWG